MKQPVNYNLKDIVTPLNVECYAELLNEVNYDRKETEFLLDSVRNGFDIGYEGPTDRCSRSENIPLSVGTEEDIWGKLMKEIKAERVAGPFDEIPFNSYIQSPVGLVPKAGNKTRMIFHLSFEFSGQAIEGSVNSGTPREYCPVRYNNFDATMCECLRLVREFENMDGRMNKDNDDTNDGRPILFLGRTDLSSALRVLPLKVRCFCWLVFKAKDPKEQMVKYFVEKCLPFGASISCSHYQRFSNSLKFILEFRLGKKGKAINNYLDDFFFVAIRSFICNQMIRDFLKLCGQLGIPVALGKTKWADTLIIFLRILLNGESFTLSVPLDKKLKALNLLNDISSKKRATVNQLQVLTGYLNFLTKAIVPGRMFTHRMYAKYSYLSNKLTKAGKKLKPHHHVALDAEFRFDCELWHTFLLNSSHAMVCHPMINLEFTNTAKQLNIYSDASANPELGVGATFNDQWFSVQWERNYIKKLWSFNQVFGIVRSGCSFVDLGRPDHQPESHNFL